MLRVTLGLATIAIVSCLFAVGRLGSEIVNDVAAFVFIGAILALLLLLASYWASQNLR